jgi:methionyl-tRNA formyltransferase
MRVAFAGSPTPAVGPLRALAASHHEVGLVITQPDKGRGRSRRPSPTPVAQAAEELGIPVLRPPTINDPEAIARIGEAGVELLAVVAFGQILRDGVLSRWPCVNVHFSLLPAYRGAAPVERAIMDGVTETGVTIMRMEAGLDTGPVYSARAVPVTGEDDGGSLTTRLSDLGGPLLVEVIDGIAAGRAAPVPQPEEGVSLAPKIGRDDRALDLSRPAVELERRVRALSPHIGATRPIGGETFKIWAARARDDDAPAGLAVQDGRLVAGCGRGSLEILELQPPGRARMDAGAFLRGWRGALDRGSVGA